MEKPRRNHQSLVWGTQMAGHTCYSGRYTVNLGKKVWPQVSKPVCSDPAVSLPGTYSQEESVEGYLIDHPLCAQMSSVRRLAKWVLGQTAMATVLWNVVDLMFSAESHQKKKAYLIWPQFHIKKGTLAWGRRIAKILTASISVGGSEWVSSFLLCVFLNILYLLSLYLCYALYCYQRKNSCDCWSTFSS